MFRCGECGEEHERFENSFNYDTGRAVEELICPSCKAVLATREPTPESSNDTKEER